MGTTKTRATAVEAVARGYRQARALDQDPELAAKTVLLALRAAGLCVIFAGDDLNAFLARRRLNGWGLRAREVEGE